MKKKFSLFLAVVLPLCCKSNWAEARIFDINNESFAAYFRGNYGPIPPLDAFQNSSGANVVFDSKFPYNLGAELGLVYATPRVNFRFGLGVLKPPSANGNGSTASGTALYSLSSEISVVTPKIGVEVDIKKWNQSRFFIEGDAGYANLLLRNSYVFTPAGSAAYNVPDYWEDIRGTTISYEGSVGFETLMTDTTTFVIDAGYRMMNFTALTQNRDISGGVIGHPAVAKGAPAVNNDGSNRTLNLSNWFAGVQFRFWIN